MKNETGYRNRYHIEHMRKGVLIGEEYVYNLVVDEGLNDTLEVYFKGNAYTATHYAGLKLSGAILWSDTMALLGNDQLAWGEFRDYVGQRPKIILGPVSNKAVDNSANRAQFTIADMNAPQGASIHGIFVATVADKLTYTGVLYGAVNFAVPRVVLNEDTLIITVEFTQSSV